MNKSVEIKKQSKFPFLRKFKNKFKITDGTIFVYKNIIYSNNELPYDLVMHEICHIKQQQHIGARKWIKLYLENDEFRFDQEVEAYKIQLKEVRKMNDKEEYAHILIECAQNLSSDFYGNLISYSEAIKILRIK